MLNYRYRVLIQEMDLFVEKQGDQSFCFTWEYIKSILHTHSLCLHQSTKEPLNIIEARVWSDWESVFSIDDEDVLEPHLFVLKGLADLYCCSAPSFAECHFWLAVAFAQARGESRIDAIDRHYLYLERQGGYERHYGEPDPRWIGRASRWKKRAKLQLIQGGRASL